MRLTIGEVIQATGGDLIGASVGDMVTGVSTDSRTLKKGDLFFALRGPHHDGHDHLEEVRKKGAACVVVSSKIKKIKTGIRVPDTLRALGDLASFWRRKFPVSVVAVTGSNGKTTTKDMIAALLERRFRVLKTEGNLNNLIGLPLTLLRLDKKVEVAVVEIGMNRPGEIDRLAEIAAPQVGVITNVARAHLERLGSLAQVARAKAELLSHLPKEGLAVLNADDPSLERLKKQVRSRLVTFGCGRSADLRLLSSCAEDLRGISFSAKVAGRRSSFRMPVLGRQNVANALAALAVADHFGLNLKEMRGALASFRTQPKRMEVVSLRKGIHLLNDCYNANPDSVEAALETLREVTKKGMRRVAILGEMLELGPSAPRLHREIGRKAAEAGVDLLIAIGEHAEEVVRGAAASSTVSFAIDSVEGAIPLILEKGGMILPGDTILIKGSRGMKMERITERLVN